MSSSSISIVPLARLEDEPTVIVELVVVKPPELATYVIRSWRSA